MGLNEVNYDIEGWLYEKFRADGSTILESLKQSPSAQGYIRGALSEILLERYLKEEGYNVWRIKEKPSGGYNKKKDGYKGDFLVCKEGEDKYYVVECKGLKSNAEFYTSDTGSDYTKAVSKKKASDTLKKFFNPDKDKIYENGKKAYEKAKKVWEDKNSGKSFPEFKWSKEYPGPDSVDLSGCFDDIKQLKQFIDGCDDTLLSETAFRENKGLYRILQTHQPTSRKDKETGKKQAGPLVSDFSIMAVDLYLRTGKHEFVFMNPDKIAHSPSSPNHLYQNYIIDIIIPGIKDELVIQHPWYIDINECISKTSPRTVEYDDSQLDHR